MRDSDRTSGFERELTRFLHWQAAQTVAAPSAAEMADRLAAGRHPSLATARPRLGLAFLALSTVIVLGWLAIVAVGALRTPQPLAPVNGPLVFIASGCGLEGRPSTPAGGTITGDAAGCGDFAELVMYRVSASADGRWLAFVRSVFCGGCGSTPSMEELQFRGLFLVDRATGRTERLAGCVDQRCEYDVALSPDGRRLAYIEAPHDRIGAPDVVTIVDLQDGTSREVVTHGSAFHGLRWSPDSSILAVRVVCGEVRACLEVGSAVLLADAERVRTMPLTERQGQTRAQDLATLAWTPDGRSIMTAMSAAADPDRSVLLRLDSERAAWTEMGEIAGPPHALTWSPDASLVAVTGFQDSVRIVEVATLEVVAQQPPDLRDPSFVAWAPDGRAFAVTATHADGRSGTFTLSLDGGDQRWLGPNEYALAWIPAYEAVDD
jgi:hypothetical protein